MHRNTKIYVFLVLVRLYYALSPSYIHPDEHFQGPEIMAGLILPYPFHLTWEFTTIRPIRSVLPLWIVYGAPMAILRWICETFGQHKTPATITYWTLRLWMFVLSVCFGDLALYKLLHSPSQRAVTMLLVASSYTTWTFQTHTFSNSIETLLLLWCLALSMKISANKLHTHIGTSAVLGCLLVFGVFNRITFPLFCLEPALRLLSHFQRRPLSFLVMLSSGLLTAFIAVHVDTAFYTKQIPSFLELIKNPVLTPLNNLLYNSSPTNLALHGLHPFYQHALANLPQLLGPAFPLILLSSHKSLRVLSILISILALSIFPHQEARFLLPTVPLILSSIRVPRRYKRSWIASWIIFNSLLGILMGRYHQGGVVPAQEFIGRQDNVSSVLWWRTYSPPIWLLGPTGRHIKLTT